MCISGFPGGSVIRYPPKGFLMQESQVRYPGQEETPGKETATPLQYSCLENPMDGEPGGLQSMGSHRVRHS